MHTSIGVLPFPRAEAAASRLAPGNEGVDGERRRSGQTRLGDAANRSNSRPDPFWIMSARTAKGKCAILAGCLAARFLFAVVALLRSLDDRGPTLADGRSMIAVRRCLLALLLPLLTPLAHGEIPLLKPKADPPRISAAATASDPRARAEAQLAEARRQQEAGQIEDGRATSAPGLSATDRQRLLGRLVVAYSEYLKQIEELENQKKSQNDDKRVQGLLATFAGPPPYSALQVDTLRDSYDTGKERLQNLLSTERALQTLKVGRIDAQRRAAEAVRLAEDRLARARGRDEIEKERLNRELALLRKQLAEAELANIGLGAERMALEIKGRQALNGEMESLLARVLPEQRLSKEELEQQQSALRKELNKVAADIDSTVAANTRRVKERERLAKIVAKTDSSAADAARLPPRNDGPHNRRPASQEAVCARFRPPSLSSSLSS